MQTVLRTTIITLVSIACAVVSGAAKAQSGSWPGVWTLIAETGHANTLICFRTWRCDQTETIIYGDDYELNSTPNETTSGPFVAEGGSVTQNTCYAPTPGTACKHWLTKK